ncbi:hypothetical protein [Gloeobacter morelensis]|nr:hypothetical protein [Gloeobacter morelensis]
MVVTGYFGVVKLSHSKSEITLLESASQPPSAAGHLQVGVMERG